MLLEGVHFDLSLMTPGQLGAKFIAVNASDIYAMGGMPHYFVIAMGVPGRCRASFIDALYRGIARAAAEMNIALVGGDTCSSRSGLVLSGTLIGSSRKTVTRSGAEPGNSLFISGTPGDSAAGLALLKRGKRRVTSFSTLSGPRKLIRKHLMPQPVPLRKLEGVTSMIDTSDGLLIDLSHLCDESRVGATIIKDRIPLSEELKTAARQLKKDPYEFALRGGEDYLLLFTSPSRRYPGAYAIGQITEKGRYIVDGRGRKRPFTAEGYEHFRTSGRGTAVN
jgi:thiamine-monophosphate kinase